MRLTSFVFAIYFGLLSLAPQWQGLEFFKLDALMNHYAQYQQEQSQKGFWSFLQEHYLQQVTDQHQEHRELPFKSAQSNALVTLFMPVSETHLLLENPISFFQKEQIFSAPNALHTNDYFECWHPPQLV